ncbi:MAG: type II toxin-antitoxin system VapC family toxin, partial [Nitrospirae bacterium]|nr:type II toxin-antitoxin system VapC family toxin [Nitrospirota bacterium]
MRTLIDSSGWIEFFTGGRLADRYESYMKDSRKLLTPTIVLYEVYKKIKRDRG